MLSTLTTKGADITLQALELGALDFIAKPSFEALLASKDSFKDILLAKVKSAVSVDQKNFALAKSLMSETSKKTLAFTGAKRANHIIAIGASTGGTEAIKHVLLTLPINSPAVVITQHIPKTFSHRFAQRLNEHCAVTVQEAYHGQKIKEGNAYIAPGDQHLTVVSKAGAFFCVLDDSEPVNRHKPSVDVLFNSLIPHADNVQAVLLTGMGQDGAKGMLALKNEGARTIVQDKESSLIWGMPGSAHDLDAHTDVCALNQVSLLVLKYAALERRQMKEIRNANK